MRMSHKIIVVTETLLSWISLLFAAIFFVVAYAPMLGDAISPAIKYSMAAAFVAAAALLHFSAGHLEKHGKLLASLHLTPLILIASAFALPALAA